MSNENPTPETVEVKAKPAPQYELITPHENDRMAVVRKVMSQDFKIDDLLNFIVEAESDKEKSMAMVKYNDAIIENIKGFHPEILEIYDALAPEKQSALLIFSKAVTEREKHMFQTKIYFEEIKKLNEEVAEIETALNLKSK